jgi:hypothetical protein
VVGERAWVREQARRRGLHCSQARGRGACEALLMMGDVWEMKYVVVYCETLVPPVPLAPLVSLASLASANIFYEHFLHTRAALAIYIASTRAQKRTR